MKNFEELYELTKQEVLNHINDGTPMERIMVDKIFFNNLLNLVQYLVALDLSL